MSAAQDLAIYAIAEGVLSGIGNDAFINHTPSGVEYTESVMFYDIAGNPPDRCFGEKNTIVRHPGVQVQVRSSDQETACTLAESIHAEIDGWGGGVISGTTYGYCEALQEPYFLKSDDSDNVYIAFDVIMSQS